MLSLTAEEQREVAVFEPFFVTRLSRGGPEGVMKWRRKLDVSRLRLLMFPLNTLNMHWTLIVVNVGLRRVEYYDSFHGPMPPHVHQIIMRWLKLRWETVGPHEDRPTFDQPGWQLLNMGKDVMPWQTNGHDCGVFVCRMAEAIARSCAWDFTQASCSPKHSELHITARVE